MWTGAFWKQALERAVKSAAQMVILAWGVGDELFDLFAADWQIAAGAALGGAFLSVLTSLASAPFSPQGTPSLVKGRE